MDKCIMLCIIIWIVVTPLIDLDCTWSCFRVLIVASLFCHIHKLFMFSTALFWKTKKPKMCYVWKREKENGWNRDRLHRRHHHFLFLLLFYFQMGILWWKNTICLHRMKREKKHIHTRDSMSRAQERSRKKT